MKRLYIGMGVLAACLCGVPAGAQSVVSVNVGTPIADVSRMPLGMNVNFLLDDDHNRRDALRTLAQALKAAGVKYLRYPGGEKSDAYLWSVPPYTSSMPTLARWAEGDWPQNQEWPSYDRTLVMSDGHTFRTDPLDFDEFMDLCREIGCVPTIVICYDSMYKPAQANGVAPTRNQLLETAREWVRYANVTKGYGVKYWEIGNESWLYHYNGGTTADVYARDLVDFSQAMKSVDPLIKVGANGESSAWWRTVLTVAGPSIDFLAVHSYPAYGWPSFSYYVDENDSLTSGVAVARSAIDAYAAPQDRSRLTIAVTETNSASWSGSWADLNDLGHAVLLFDIIGEHLQQPEIEFTQLWTTRWSGNDTTAVPVLWDAFDKQNNLQATGSVLAIWTHFLKDSMVASSGSGGLKTYATYSPGSRALTVFVVNKSRSAQSATLAIDGLSASVRIHSWSLSGYGDADLYPGWFDQGEVAAASRGASVTVPPTSVLVLDVTPLDSVNSVPGRIEAEDFDEGAYWDSTPTNLGGGYRSTDVDIQATSDVGGGYNVGWIASGEWLGYTIDVARDAAYRPSVRVASPYGETMLTMLIDGAPISDAVTLPNTGGWQSWQTVQFPSVSLSAGRHVLTVATTTGAFNLNWISLDDAPANGRVVPGTIEAEDFDEGAYADSTPENLGGQYRSSGVDIQATSDVGGGYNVGWIASGEWLEYTIVARSPGVYALAARVASPYSGTRLGLSVDGVPAASIDVPNTGSWQGWTTAPGSTVYLDAGVHRLRMSTDTGAFNINKIFITVP